MNRTDSQVALRESSCASKVVRYVVVPLVLGAMLLNSRDIFKYFRLVAMSAGSARRERG